MEDLSDDADDLGGELLQIFEFVVLGGREGIGVVLLSDELLIAEAEVF